MEEKMLKTGNDLTVDIKKSNGEIVFHEECCTTIQLVLKNSGEIATSFFGAHNPQIVKIFDKSLKKYFKALKKRLKNEYKNSEEEVKLLSEELPDDKKWHGEDFDHIESTDSVIKTDKKEKEKTSKKQSKNIKKLSNNNKHIKSK